MSKTPKQMDADAAWGVARGFAESLRERLGGRLQAVIVIGSLGAGKFRPGISDIDTVVVVDDAAGADVPRIVHELREAFRIEHRIPKELGAVVVRHAELAGPYTPESELVHEVIRLKRQGVVIHGQLDLDAVRLPSDEEIRSSERAFYGWLRRDFVDQRPPSERTVDAVVNTILLELRLAIWDATGSHILNKREMVDAFIRVPDAAKWSDKLSPIKQYLTDGSMSLGMTPLEELLREISGWVRSRVPWSA